MMYNININLIDNQFDIIQCALEDYIVSLRKENASNDLINQADDAADELNRARNEFHELMSCLKHSRYS